MGPLTLLVAAYATALAQAEFYETFSGEQISPAKYAQYQALNLVPYCAQEIKTCDEHEPRRLDYSCNNLHHPVRGSFMTPYRRMLPPVFGRNFDHRPQTSGAPLPPARSVRTSILSDGRVASEQFSMLLLNIMLVSILDVSTIHDTYVYVAAKPTCCITGESDPRCLPISIPDDDPHLRYSTVRCMNLTRVITYQDLGCAPATLPPERINLSAPMLELSIVYGVLESRARRGREMRGGRLRAENINGKEYPPTGFPLCLQNQPALGETRCHDSPDVNMNLLIGPQVFILWLYRNHNRLARELERMNPCWNDEKIYLTAREINIATFNQIQYYELLPLIMGRQYLLDREIIYKTSGHVNDYNPKLEPRVSIEWITAMRYFHSMQDGRLNKYTRQGRLLQTLNIVELSFRSGILTVNGTIEGITQAFFRQGAGENDDLIDPDMGERVLSNVQTASDVMSINIMKNRQAAMPPYVEYRRHCHLPVPKNFDDLAYWMPQEKVDALRFSYERVEDIDLLVGVLVERPDPGEILAPTLKCLLADQLWWWRKADRFWYENDQHPGALTKEQLHEIRGMSVARLICDNGDDVDAIQPMAFLLPGHDNKIVPCAKIRNMDLRPWKDHCSEDYEDHEETKAPVWKGSNFGEGPKFDPDYRAKVDEILKSYADVHVSDQVKMGEIWKGYDQDDRSKVPVQSYREKGKSEVGTDYDQERYTKMPQGMDWKAEGSQSESKLGDQGDIKSDEVLKRYENKPMIVETSWKMKNDGKATNTPLMSGQQSSHVYRNDFMSPETQNTKSKNEGSLWDISSKAKDLWKNLKSGTWTYWGV